MVGCDAIEPRPWLIDAAMTLDLRHRHSSDRYIFSSAAPALQSHVDVFPLALDMPLPQVNRAGTRAAPYGRRKQTRRDTKGDKSAGR